MQHLYAAVMMLNCKSEYCTTIKQNSLHLTYRSITLNIWFTNFNVYISSTWNIFKIIQLHGKIFSGNLLCKKFVCACI